MTVAELIEELKALPPDAVVLVNVPDLGFSTVDPDLGVSYARQDPNDWWQVYWARGVPTVDGFQPVVIL